MSKVIRVVTRDTFEDMLEAGGSAAWYGNRASFEAAEYFLAVRRGHNRQPILLARIDQVVAVPESGPNRFSLQFKKYVRADDLPYDEDRSSNPAISREWSSILPNVSPDDLDWQTAPSPNPEKPWSFSNGHDRAQTDVRPKRAARGMTIAEAKRGLSIGLGVAEDQIEILIKA